MIESFSRDQLSVLVALARQTYTSDGKWARATLAMHGYDRFGKRPTDTQESGDGGATPSARAPDHLQDAAPHAAVRAVQQHAPVPSPLDEFEGH